MDVKNIFQKICDELGGEYRMFFCNSPLPLQSDEFNLALETPKVVGVGYVTNGSLIPLVNSTAEQVSLFIEFGVPTVQTEQRIAEIEEVIRKLNAKYGEITYTDENGATLVATKYVVVFGTPAPTAPISPTLGHLRQTFGVTVNIVTSEDVAFGNASRVAVEMSVGTYNDVENTINAQWSNSNEVIPKVGINSYTSTVEAQYASDRLTLSYYYNGSAVHRLFENHALSDANVVYGMRYQQNGTITNFKARMLSYTHTNPVGDFQQVTATFAKTSEGLIEQSIVLTITPAENSSITVSRDGIALSSGDYVYPGDILTVSSAANDGYYLTSLTVNGVSISSGTDYIVKSSDVNGVVITNSVEKGAVPTYTLSVSANEGVSVVVLKNGQSLQNEAIIAQNDVLQISAVAQNGYRVQSLMVNGSPFTSGNSIVVTSNVSVVATTSTYNYTLSVDVGFNEGIVESVKNQVNLKIYRKSNFAGESLNELIFDSDTASELPTTVTVSYGDTLSAYYTITNTNKFVMSSFEINDIEQQNNATFTIGGATVLNLKFGYVYYLFSVNKLRSGMAINVSTGTSDGKDDIPSGSYVHYGQMIYCRFSTNPKEGDWRIAKVTVVNPTTYTFSTNYVTSQLYRLTVEGIKGETDAQNSVISIGCTAAALVTLYDYEGNLYEQAPNYYPGGTFAFPSYPSNIKYEFKGWGTSVEGGAIYEAGDIYTGSTASFYAQGRKKIFISFTAQKGTDDNIVWSCNKYWDGALFSSATEQTVYLGAKLKGTNDILALGSFSKNSNEAGPYITSVPGYTSGSLIYIGFTAMSGETYQSTIRDAFYVYMIL